MYKNLLYVLLLTFLCSCESNEQFLFQEVSHASNIYFNNKLEFSLELNPYTYRNFYNGGGVGLGDINNDGLLDIFFAGNLVDNKLFLNKGNFQFQDITEKAGLASYGVWSTGISFVDINGDNWLDIYVSKSGTPGGENRHNELFINNGDLTFSEQAQEFGIDDTGLSNHSVFFDYDRDGDLDMYLLNNSFAPIGNFDMLPEQRLKRDIQGGNKLYRNDDGHYIDVSEQAGIYGSKIGFGLGISIGDLNGDGWQDMYVSNDFFERDYLYMNNQDGSFKEVIDSAIMSISMNSMGADIADLNHDGYPEVFVTDMLPEPEARYKTKTAFDSWDRYQQKVENGFHQQFTRNTLQLNNGNGTFSEIGRLLDVEATDWSWAALMADFNQDEYTDLFVANGIYQDLTDQDYITHYSNPELFESVIKKEAPVEDLFSSIPSNPIPNYAFSGSAGLKFTDVADSWGLGAPSFSNGSAYGDLDNDGDLDLVVNNVNMESFVYRNRANEQGKGHWLQVLLEGKAPNTQGVGAQLSIWAGNKLHWREQMPQRGFQSSVDPRLHVGLGRASRIDSLRILWPDGREQWLRDVAVDQALILRQAEAQKAVPVKESPAKEPILARSGEVHGLDWQHIENAFVDFDRERLLFHMRSTEGPAGCTDYGGHLLYLGGAKGQPGSLWARRGDGGWQEVAMPLLQQDALAENTDCVFFDADSDGDADLYVASGGNDFSSSSQGLLDRLYLNTGEGWQRSHGIKGVARLMPTGAVAAADWDGDGDMDLFVGERLRPFSYGRPVDGRLLVNDGQGNFEDRTKELAPGLQASGLYTGASWADVNGDGDLDLVAVGEWMPVRVFANRKTESGQAYLEEITDQAGLGDSQGWWNQVLVEDLDGDGDADILGLNHGRNSRFRATRGHPVSLWVGDFDGNGSTEQVLSVWNGEGSYPMVLRHDLVDRLPGLKKKYLKYEAYKEQAVEDIFTEEQLSRVRRLQAGTLESMVYWNDGEGHFSGRALPVQAQLAPMYAAATLEGNRIVLGGNLWGVKPEAGRYDASYGAMLEVSEDGTYRYIAPGQSGFHVNGQVRQLLKAGSQLIVLRNNQQPLVFEK